MLCSKKADKGTKFVPLSVFYVCTVNVNLNIPLNTVRTRELENDEIVSMTQIWTIFQLKQQ